MIKVLVCDGAGTIGFPNPSHEMRELLESLSSMGISLGVASNSATSEVIRKRFRAVRLTPPDAIVTAAEIGVKKPSPEFVQKLRERLNADLNEMIYLGDDDNTDALCAINSRILPFAAYYSSSMKPKKYGIPVDSPKQLQDYLRSFGVQSEPYFGWRFSAPPNSAHSRVDVRVLIGEHRGFTEMLKAVFKSQQDLIVGSKDNRVQSLIFHYCLSQCYLSGLMADVDLITVYPGHLADSTNPVLNSFSVTLTQITRSRFIPDLLVRHRDAEKSQFAKERKIIEQFRTINVNPSYTDRVQGKTILVFDDFTTSGYSLETARHMLLRAGAKRVVGVAIAKYRNYHSVARITDDWDPYIPCTLQEGDIQIVEIPGAQNLAADNYFKNQIWPVYSR